MNIIDELLGLVTELEADGTPYALCGGLAVGLHGCPRFTYDIDILAPKEALERVREAAHRRRFVLESGSIRFGAGTERERELHRFTKVDDQDALTLDVLLVGPAYDHAWRTRATIAFEGRHLWVVSREGLIEMKRLSGRARDVADILALEGRGEERIDGGPSE
jgi:hypothetical protein